MEKDKIYSCENACTKTLNFGLGKIYVKGEEENIKMFKMY